MKKIEAIIKPHRLEAVKDALHELGVAGMTVYEVELGVRLAERRRHYAPAILGMAPTVAIEIPATDADPGRLGHLAAALRTRCAS